MNSKVIKLELQEIQLLKLSNLLKDLTPSETKVLGALVSFIKKNTYSPTIIELGEILGMTKQSVSLFIRSLENKGYIKRVGRGRIDVTYKDAELTIENLEKLEPVLIQLKELLEKKLITQEDYDIKRRELLGISVANSSNKNP